MGKGLGMMSLFVPRLSRFGRERLENFPNRVHIGAAIDLLGKNNPIGNRVRVANSWCASWEMVHDGAREPGSPLPS